MSDAEDPASEETLGTFRFMDLPAEVQLCIADHYFQRSASFELRRGRLARLASTCQALRKALEPRRTAFLGLDVEDQLLALPKRLAAGQQHAALISHAALVITKIWTSEDGIIPAERFSAQVQSILDAIGLLPHLLSLELILEPFHHTQAEAILSGVPKALGQLSTLRWLSMSTGKANVSIAQLLLHAPETLCGLAHEGSWEEDEWIGLQIPMRPSLTELRLRVRHIRRAVEAGDAGVNRSEGLGGILRKVLDASPSLVALELYFPPSRRGLEEHMDSLCAACRPIYKTLKHLHVGYDDPDKEEGAGREPSPPLPEASADFGEFEALQSLHLTNNAFVEDGCNLRLPPALVHLFVQTDLVPHSALTAMILLGEIPSSMRFLTLVEYHWAPTYAVERLAEACRAKSIAQQTLCAESWDEGPQPFPWFSDWWRPQHAW